MWNDLNVSSAHSSARPKFDDKHQVGVRVSFTLTRLRARLSEQAGLDLIGRNGDYASVSPFHGLDPSVILFTTYRDQSKASPKSE